MILGDQVMVLRHGAMDGTKLIQSLMTPRPIKNLGHNKPGNAFWTSTVKGRSSDWIDWCSSEEPEWVKNGDAVTFTVQSGAKILSISSPGDLQDVMDIYPWEAGRERYSNEALIDWVEVARDYDAVHVSARMAKTNELYSWMVESTAWFRPKLKIKEFIKVDQSCKLRAAARLAMAIRIANRHMGI